MTKLTEMMIASFAQAEWESFDLREIALDESKAMQALADDLCRAFTDLNSGATRQKRHERFAVPETTPEDYSERLIELGPERHVICGIRHMNLNPKHPFIQLRANFALSGTEQIQRIFSCIEAHFSVFDPMYVAVNAPRPIGSMVAQVHLVQRAGVIQAMPPWSTEAVVEIRQVTNQSYFEAYQGAYARFHQHHPELTELVPVNQLDLMEASREAGLLYAMHVDGQQAGLIAAAKSDFLGLPGLYFNELVIWGPHIGKGYAKALQRKFILECASPETIVWGTIHARNVPSSKTALANKRRPIRYESFVPTRAGIPSSPGPPFSPATETPGPA